MPPDPRGPQSMTGFGAGRREGQGWVAVAEIRAVNHRFLQIKTRLSPELASWELEVERLLRESLARGAVAVRLDLARTGGTPATLDRAVLSAYAEELAAAAASLSFPNRLELGALLGLPGVLAPPSGPDPEALWPLAEAALREALGGLLEMRRREGQALVQDLAARLARLAALLGDLRERTPAVLAAAEQRLRARVAELMAGQGAILAEVDLAREVALLADRMDVTEEITRLSSHLAQLDAVLAAGGEVGKRLDFLLQEMGREVNTTGAKCQDAGMAHLVVELKVELERLREQVQNLE